MLSESNEQILYLDFPHKHILNKQHQKISLDNLSPEIEGILRLLVDENYIIYDDPSHYPNGEFRLTHKGLHWRQIHNKSILIYLLKSVVVPIVVSILTTIITLRLN